MTNQNMMGCALQCHFFAKSESHLFWETCVEVEESGNISQPDEDIATGFMYHRFFGKVKTAMNRTELASGIAWTCAAAMAGALAFY